MKKIIANVLMALMLPLFLNAKAPSWVSRKPAAENDTYRYVVESATGQTETAAMNKAMGQVYLNAISALGRPVSSEQMETAIKTGSFESISIDFKIPVNKVCSYTEGLNPKGSGVRVYVLCQVAVKSDRVQKPQFTEFRNCGKQGGKDVAISGRPDEWGMFDSDEYFSYSTESELEKGQNEQDAKMDLIAEARKSLVRNLNMTEESADKDVISLIQAKAHYNTKTKDVYAVAFVKKDDVNRIYSEKVYELIDVCDHKIRDAKSHINENDMSGANALLDNVKNKIDNEIGPRLNFLSAHSDDRHVARYVDEVKDLREQLMDSKSNLRLDLVKSKKDKVQEFVRSGVRSKRENKLGDALRYYYAAQVLLHEMQNPSSVTLSPSEGEAPINANSYIMSEIKSILTGVKISFVGFLQGSETEAQLGFLYNGVSVTNLNYTYNDNTGWSDDMPVKDGWTVISLPANNRPKNIHVKLEYRYEDEAAFDPELQNIIAKHRFNYEDEALHLVEISNTTVKPTHGGSTAMTGSSDALKSSTSMNQNIVADRITEKRHEVQLSDSARYVSIIDNVCKGINSNNYDGIQGYFTANGCLQLEKLLKYGRAKVLSMSNCRFVRMGDEVMCRSIPMSFTFKKGKKTLENVVFTFDASGKIDGIQFALEERSARNIMCEKGYSETSKLALVNFMENYKTAFAMMRLDYINSIFADDAVIIIGRVLQNTNSIDLGQKKVNDVKYTKYTKQEYMARLANQFKSKEWINIKFSNTTFDKSAQGNIYSIQLLQDYSSDNYGDRGYLFLLIDCTDPDKPVIKVRTWQPETAGDRPFSMAEYDELVNGR